MRFNTISTDSFAGANLVINHISKLGYKNILIVGDKKTILADTTAINDIINAIVQKPGINRPVVVDLEKPEAGCEIDSVFLEKFLRPPYRAEVMIIMNAGLVYPLMTLLRNKKLRVPQDIAVISMEEGAGFDLMFSPVTSLRKPFSGMSVKVANMIWSEVKNSGKGKFKRQVNIAPELVVRNSCGTI